MTLTEGQIRHILHKHKAWVDHFCHTGKDDVRSGTRLAIHGPELAGADLQAVVLDYAHLDGADLRGANLRYANLQNTLLQGADLRDAMLTGSNFYKANLQCADLRGTHLHNTLIQGADLRGAKIDMSFRRCLGFHRSLFTADALPWLILHPKWSELKDTVLITNE